MHGRSDDPADAEGDGSGEDGGRDVAFLDDLSPQIERRGFGQQGEGGREHGHSERGEDERVQ